MLTLLYIILAVDIFSIIFSFFMLLSSSVLYAVLFIAVALLGLVPILVLIRHVEKIEELEHHLQRLQSEVKRLTDALNGDMSSPEKRRSPCQKE